MKAACVSLINLAKASDLRRSPRAGTTTEATGRKILEGGFGTDPNGSLNFVTVCSRIKRFITALFRCDGFQEIIHKLSGCRRSQAENAIVTQTEQAGG